MNFCGIRVTETTLQEEGMKDQIWKRGTLGVVTTLALLAMAGTAGAEEFDAHSSIISLGYGLDTFYLLMSGALVMWMAAGFTMLEAGLVRSKNVVVILTKNIALYSVACIMYLLFGYQIMYGGGSGVLPGFSFFIGPEHTTAAVLAAGGDIPYAHLADFFFQVCFVATAMSIVSGAVAERMKLWTFLAFALVLCGFIYPIEGYWQWGGGFLKTLGFIDFAGSGVVHLCGAAAALAGVLVLGPRTGKYKNGKIKAFPGSNLPLAALGTLILWVGWFGFNGGSQLKVSTIADANAVAMAFVNTNGAAAAGLVTALLLSQFWFRKADLTMALNGALAGLVAITAEPTAPGPLLATGIGAVAGVLVVVSIITIDKLKIDDPVGALSVHGVCGIFGLLAVSLSAGSFVDQLTGVVCIFAWVFITSLITWKILKVVMGLRVSEEEEYSGVDVAECGLEAYPEFSSDK